MNVSILLSKYTSRLNILYKRRNNNMIYSQNLGAKTFVFWKRVFFKEMFCKQSKYTTMMKSLLCCVWCLDTVHRVLVTFSMQLGLQEFWVYNVKDNASKLTMWGGFLFPLLVHILCELWSPSFAVMALHNKGVFEMPQSSSQLIDGLPTVYKISSVLSGYLCRFSVIHFMVNL